MFSLIKKDFITSIKAEGVRNIKYLFILSGVYFFINAAFYNVVSIFISYIILANTFSQEHENDSYLFLKSMPMNKDDLVYSKYIISLGLIIINTVIVIILSYLLSAYLYRKPVLNDVFFSVNEFLMISSIILPMYFKFGYKKVRILCGAISIGVVSVYGMIINVIAERINNFGTDSNVSYVGFGSSLYNYIYNQADVRVFNLYNLTILTSIVFIVSMYISLKIAKSKY